MRRLAVVSLLLAATARLRAEPAPPSPPSTSRPAAEPAVLEAVPLEAEDGEIIEVRGETEETKVRRSAYPVSVVTTEQLANRAVDLSSAIDRAAGARVRQTGGLGSAANLSLRGLGGKRVRVFVDGRPLDLGGAIALDDIPLQFIERIEIYKGVVPARLGADGLAGAVNVVMKDLAEEYSEASYTIESFGVHRIAGGHRAHVLGRDDVTLGAGGFLSHAENDYVMESPYQPGLRIRRDHDAYAGAAAAVMLQLDDFYFDRIDAELAWVGNRKEVQGVQQNIQHARTSSHLLVGVVELERERFLVPSLDLEYALSVPVVRARFIDDSPVRYGFDGSMYPSPTGRGEIGPLPHDRVTHTTEIRQRLNLRWRASERHGFNLNSVLRGAWIDAEDPLAEDAAGRPIGGDGRLVTASSALAHELVAGRLAHTITAKHFALSSRGELVDPFMPREPTPISVTRSVFGVGDAARLAVGSDLFVRASYERTWRLPDAAELFGDGFLVTPSPGLRPEAGHNLNAGVLYDRPTRAGRIRADAGAFASWLRDAITLGSDPQRMGHVNLGEVRVLGIEAEIAADVTPWLFVRAAGTYQDLRDVRRTAPGTNVANPTYGLRVPNVPWLYGNAGLDVRWPAPLGKRGELRVFWDTRYAAEFFHGWQLSANQERVIPAALTHAAGVELSLRERRASVSIEIENLTGARVIDVYNTPLPGRAVKAKVRALRF